MIISEKISSQLKEIPKFINSLLMKIKPFLNEDEFFDVRLSLEEALVNAIKHGNKMQPNLAVDIFLEIRNNKLTIEVHDEGCGFDYNKISDPTKLSNLNKPFGRGIFLIKNLMDEVKFFDSGRGIKIVKFLKKEVKNDCKRRKN